MEHSHSSRLPVGLASLKFRRSGPASPRGGFTLIEMLVVIAIIAIITVVVITSQSSFNRTLLLANAAYDVALTIRSAETYGIASRAAGAVVTTGHGIHFSGTPSQSFILFADSTPPPSSNAARCHPANDVSAPDAKPGDCAYQPDQKEFVTTYTLGNGMTITNFCAIYGNGTYSCAADNTITSLDIVFVRPSGEPYMSVNGAYSSISPVTAACLAIASPQGGARYVSIASTGQISAAATSCP